jgi:hypothetical protein
MKGIRLNWALTLLLFLGFDMVRAQDNRGAATQEPANGEPGMSGMSGKHWRLDAWGKGQDVVKLLEKMKAENPEEYRRLEELRRTDLEQFFREVRGKLPRRSEFAGKIGQIERQCREMGQQYLAAKDEAEKKRLEAELLTLLKESFDLVIKDAKGRIERLQKHVDDMQVNEQKILDERRKMFLQAAQDAPPPPPPPPAP